MSDSNLKIDSSTASSHSNKKVLWKRKICKSEFYLSSKLERYKFLLKKFNNKDMDFFIEKGVMNKKSNIYLVIHSDFGLLWIDNYQLFLTSLTGITIDLADISDLKKRLNLLTCCIDEKLLDCLKWSYSDISSAIPLSELFSLSFRISSSECNIISTVYAKPDVILKIINQSCFNTINIDYDPLCISPVYIGHVFLTRYELFKMDRGCLIVLSDTNFDINGVGYLNVGDKIIKIKWLMGEKNRNCIIIDEIKKMENKDHDDSNINMSNDEGDLNSIEETENHEFSEEYSDDMIDENDIIKNESSRVIKDESHVIGIQSSIDSIPIKIDVYIGSFSMLESEIKDLRKNDLIYIDRCYQHQVSLRIDQKEIGIGEIIAMDDDLAIQVINIWK